MRSTLGFEIRRCTYSVTSRTQRCYVNLIVGMAGWHASVTLTPPDRYSPPWRGGEIFQTATRRGIPPPPSRKTSTEPNELSSPPLSYNSLAKSFYRSEIVAWGSRFESINDRSIDRSIAFHATISLHFRSRGKIYFGNDEDKIDPFLTGCPCLASGQDGARGAVNEDIRNTGREQSPFWRVRNNGVLTLLSRRGQRDVKPR